MAERPALKPVWLPGSGVQDQQEQHLLNHSTAWTGVFRKGVLFCIKCLSWDQQRPGGAPGSAECLLSPHLWSLRIAALLHAHGCPLPHRPTTRCCSRGHSVPRPARFTQTKHPNLSPLKAQEAAGFPDRPRTFSVPRQPPAPGVNARRVLGPLRKGCFLGERPWGRWVGRTGSPLEHRQVPHPRP